MSCSSHYGHFDDDLSSQSLDWCKTWVNPFKPSGIKCLHFKVFRAIPGTGLTHLFNFFLTFGRVPECQKIGKGGLDQYGAECFGRLIFTTIRKKVKKCGTERVKPSQTTTKL